MLEAEDIFGNDETIAVSIVYIDFSKSFGSACRND